MGHAVSRHQGAWGAMDQERESEKLTSLEKGLLLYDLLLPDRWQSSKSLGQQVGVDSRTIKSYARILASYGWPVKGQNGRNRGYYVPLHADAGNPGARPVLRWKLVMARPNEVGDGRYAGSCGTRLETGGLALASLDPKGIGLEGAPAVPYRKQLAEGLYRPSNRA